MQDRGIAKWNKMQRLGRNKYLLYYGVLLWGIVFAVILGAVELASTGIVTSTWTVIRFFVFGVVGFFIGSARWMRYERRYGSDNSSGGQAGKL